MIYILIMYIYITFQFDLNFLIYFTLFLICVLNIMNVVEIGGRDL